MTPSFATFKSRCLSILAQSNNCADSQSLFSAANDYTDMVLAWQRFWAGIINEVPTQVLEAFAELYPTYKTDLNRAGIYYNEQWAVLPRNAIMLVGAHPTNPEFVFHAYGAGKVYVLGAAHVQATDNVQVYCSCPDATIYLYKAAKGIMSCGRCEARERSTVTGKGTFLTNDYATAFITSGILEDYGHCFIEAYNDVIIKSFTHKGITLHDKAEIILRQ